jgi:hypothetical protein
MMGAPGNVSIKQLRELHIRCRRAAGRRPDLRSLALPARRRGPVNQVYCATCQRPRRALGRATKILRPSEKGPLHERHRRSR